MFNRPHALTWWHGACVVALLSGSDCPVRVGDQTPAEAPPDVDFGGAQGALFAVDFAPELTVTLRHADNVETRRTAIGAGPLALDRQLVDVTGFCLRADVLCPQQLLRARTQLSQNLQSGTVFFSPLTARGPLSNAGQTISGAADRTGNELYLPLDTPGVPYCGLLDGSALTATAITEPGGRERDAAAARVTALRGRVTHVYDATCWTTGGTAALPPEAIVELSAEFNAQRQ